MPNALCRDAVRPVDVVTSIVSMPRISRQGIRNPSPTGSGNGCPWAIARYGSAPIGALEKRKRDDAGSHCRQYANRENELKVAGVVVQQREPEKAEEAQSQAGRQHPGERGVGPVFQYLVNVRATDIHGFGFLGSICSRNRIGRQISFSGSSGSSLPDDNAVKPAR